MPAICSECLKITKKLSKQKLKEEDLGWEICKKCGFLRPFKIKRIKFINKKSRN